MDFPRHAECGGVFRVLVWSGIWGNILFNTTIATAIADRKSVRHQATMGHNGRVGNPLRPPDRRKWR